jgi:oxaloacetate decarboxylase (Na+ extruding) subunit alpha
MISNFRYQLGKAGMENRLPEVLEEIGRVRAEFGYPIMVTPYSQFIGVQATMNVIVGERYKEVPDEVIQYALGLWGAEECSSIDPNVRDRVLSRPRARELAHWIPPQPSVKEFRDRLGGAGVSDDELLLRYFSSEADVEAMQAAGPPNGSFRVKHPLVMLLESLLKRNDRRQIYIQTKDIRVRLEKRAAD